MVNQRLTGASHTADVCLNSTKPTPVKPILLTLVASALFIGTCAAQEQTKNSVQSIKIEDDGENPVVKITSIEGGKKIKKTLKGDKAREYIEQHENNSNSSSPAYTFSISTQTSEEFKEDFRHVKAEVNQEVRNAASELQKIELDSVMSSVGATVDRALASVNTSTGSAKKTPRKKLTIEDDSENEESSDLPVSISQKSSGNSSSITVRVEDAGTEKMTIKVIDSEGETHHTSVVNGDGTQTINIDLNHLAAGEYSLEVKQGKRSLTKKLTIQ